MVFLKCFLLSLLTVLPSFAETLVHLRGSVQKIENGRVFLRHPAGHVTQVPLKYLSLKDKKMVNEAIVSKQVIEMRVIPQAFQKISSGT